MIGVEIVVGTGLVFPLVRLVEVLVDVAVLLLCVAEEEEEERRGEVVLDATGEEGGRREEGEVCLGGDVLGAPDGEGRIGREYVRRAGVAVEVSLGGAGTRMWGDGAPTVAAILGMWVAETEGAGVRGGGGEEVVGVSVGAGESRSMGLGVSRGGLGVVGVEESAAIRGLVPLVASPCSDWL